MTLPAAFEFLSERLEPAAVRLNEFAPSNQAETTLDHDLPGWRVFSQRVRTLLTQAERDYLDTTRVDYTGSEINYAKAVEVTIIERLFIPFRNAGYTEANVMNDQAFKPFMLGKGKLTLGNFPFLFSRKEKTFRNFVQSQYPDADNRIFNKDGIMGLLSHEQIQSRNGSAHEDVVSRDRATTARQWAMQILRWCNT